MVQQGTLDIYQEMFENAVAALLIELAKSSAMNKAQNRPSRHVEGEGSEQGPKVTCTDR